jgi:hypothetical protein
MAEKDAPKILVEKTPWRHRSRRWNARTYYAIPGRENGFVIFHVTDLPTRKLAVSLVAEHLEKVGFKLYHVEY